MHDNDVAFPYKSFADWLITALAAADFSQAQLAQSVFVGESVISEYLSGNKIPRDERVGWIAAVLNCNEDELADVYLLPAFSQRKYNNALRAFSQFRVPWPSMEDLLADARAEIQAARTLRVLGAPQTALDQLDRWIGRLLKPRLEKEETKATGKRAAQERLLNHLRELLIEAYIERMICSATLQDRFHVIDAMMPDFIQAHRLAQEIGHPGWRDRATAWLADGYYIAHNPREVIRRAESLAGTSADPTCLYITLRACILAYAHSNNMAKYQEMVVLARNHLDDGTIHLPGDRVSLMEGLGQGGVVLGQADSDKWLTQAEREARKAGLPLRTLQVLRTWLMALAYTRNQDQDLAEEIALEMLVVAQRDTYNVYERYVRQLIPLTVQLDIYNRISDQLEQEIGS